MKSFPKNKIPSIFKKFLMALTGFILAGFVLVHMAGNLQMFVGPDAMNEYAHFLQTLPYKGLWIFRFVLGLSVFIHLWMAISLTYENCRARPRNYRVKNTVQATLGSKTMAFTGAILLFFIVFHIAHFTLRIVFPEFQTDTFFTTLNGIRVYDVYKMVLMGFSHTWVSLFYIFAMALLCMHLTHGVSSMFQSLGLRNEKWRYRLDALATVYGWVVFLGFIAIPACVLLSTYVGINLFPTPITF